MTIPQHVAISWLMGGRRAVLAGIAPDLGNVFLLTPERLPERDWRVRLSRVTHSPLTVVALLALSPEWAWPYALHWACDAITHQSHQWLWPFVRMP